MARSELRSKSCAFIGAALVWAASASAQNSGPPPAAVRVDPARLETVQNQRMVTGELRALRKARVATQEPGLVLDILIEEGRAVRSGEVLAKLDSARLEIDLRDVEAQAQAAAAAVDERASELAWRERDLQTYQAVSQREAGNPKELYDAEAQASIARARLAAARQQVEVTRSRADLLRKRIADMSIAAPFDGVIVTKIVERGEWVEEGGPLFEIVSTGALDAWLDVPQQLAGTVIGKQPAVTVMVDATSASIEASHVRSVPQVDPRARTFSLIARLDNREGVLAPGMSVTGWVPTGEQGEQLTISKDSVLRNEVGPYVYVARSSRPGTPATAAPAPVQILFSWKGRFVIRAGAVAPGDNVIVEGNERLFPMAPVTPLPAGGSTTGPSAENAGSEAANSGGSGG